MKSTYTLFAAVFLVVEGFSASQDVIIENARFKLVLGGNACAKSLVVKATGEECLAPDGHPFFSVTQERPYNNENKLTHPNCRTEYGATSVAREGSVLVVGFRLARYKAEIEIDERPDYAVFTLKGFRAADKDYGSLKMDRPPAVELRLARLPLKARANFGEWLGVVWDDRAAVALQGTSPDTFVSHDGREYKRVLMADVKRGYRFTGGSVALVAAAGRESFLDCTDRFEQDFDLPRGVANRRNPLVNASVFWVPDLAPTNVDAYIEYAKKGGFRMMLVYYTSLVKERNHWLRCGEWAFRDEYANGFSDVTAMLGKIRAAGITPGLHVLHSHIGLTTSYVTPVADHRLGLKRLFTLARPLDVKATEVFVEENPVDAPISGGTRILKFGGELFAYDSYSTEPPYRFTGVKRGKHKTRVTAHPLGEIGGILDISEFGGPDSCYVHQDNSLQDEIADKIAAFWKCGFNFIYMDGSEGVDAPFGRNVALGQYRVWKRLEPRPILGEAAAKSHFGWHMLSGANAFDVFPPSYFKNGLLAHPFAEAKLMRQDMTRVNFGWWGLWTPAHVADDPKKSPGTQLDMWEFGTSKAAAWDCPVTIQFKIEDMAQHPRMNDLLEMMRRWEDVRAKKWLTPEQKAMLKSRKREFHLYVNETGGYELHEIEMLPEAKSANHLRGFVFTRDGKRMVAYWHTAGTGKANVVLDGETRELAVADLKYLETNLSADEIKKAFAGATMEEK